MNIKDTKDRVKAHVVRNKERYIAVVALVGTNVIWYLATKNGGPMTEIGDIDGDHNSIAVDNSVTHIDTQINYTPNRLSYIVTDGEEYWETQGDCARDIGESEANVSKHLNHGRRLDSGVELRRVGVRSGSQ